MANYCNFSMEVSGKRENCYEFLDILQYKHGDRYFDRVYDIYSVEEYPKADGTVSVGIAGDCAWSVWCSMCDNRSQHTTLEIETARLNLDIEIYSTENSMEFAEHIHYKKGELLLNECVDYQEIWFDEDDDLYPSLDAYNAQHGTSFTKDDLIDGDCLVIGGFGR